ncbi:GntR family transcriptional regulator [Massilia sp. WF1]|uniref:GntR family transcriptional regulator n=1 Tax=unclassified Massilia TaxID=2609279 RepID=UPI00064AFF82|nr:MULTISPECIES: GntR family transcriptional regulator [unclassified Massilia]ALK97561.1 GntR family transcriptional regulator [Massilia sp. WG5]KLU35982.1 GntR family transcriptional regulator [Massilia sp. WF1]
MNNHATPPVIASIDRLGLSAAVGARLRDMIVEGVLAPGTRLNERMLCEQLNVSRTPLREAFKTLAVEGLIVLQPNRGAVVAQMSVPEIEQTFEVMGALESLSGELACARATDEEIAEVRALHFEMLAAHARRDLPSYYKLNHAIHDRINAMARNTVLTETYQQINARIQSLRFRSNFNQDKWDAAVEEHGRMQEALERRDGNALRLILQQHLRNKRDAVIAVLRAAQNAATGTSGDL